MTVALELPDAVLDEIARRVAELIQPPATPGMNRWLNTEQAATYIAAKPGRIHDLVALGKLTPHRDGRRLLFRSDDLDAYLEANQ